VIDPILGRLGNKKTRTGCITYRQAFPIQSIFTTTNLEVEKDTKSQMRRKLWLSAPKKAKLQSVPNPECRLGTTEIAQWKSKISMVMEDINPIFPRLAILSNLFGQPIETTRHALVLTEPPQPELSFSFHGLTEARNPLYNLMDMCQVVLKAALLFKWAPDNASIGRDALFMHQQKMLLNLDN
jgi:hypothetical protein